MVAPRYIYIYNKNIIPDFEHMPAIHQMLNSDQKRPEQYTYDTEEDFLLQEQKMPVNEKSYQGKYPQEVAEESKSAFL